MPLIVLDIELTEKSIIKELELFIDGSLQEFSFCPPKIFKPKKHTIWNTSHLNGIAWSSGKLDYDKLFTVFYDLKVMNAEVFAKGLESCTLLTRLIRKKVEILDDYSCPEIQDLVKTDSLWICSFLSDKRQGFTVPRGKRSAWRMGYATFVNFVRLLCICIYY